MCDYSLHLFPNRLGVEGEELIVHRFGGASLGLASPSDLPVLNMECSARSRWARLKSWFQRPMFETDTRIPAVCIPPGARLMLRDIPKTMQRDMGIGETEPVVFAQTSAEANTYRDAIRFENGRQMLLQFLQVGQRVTLVSLSPSVDESIFARPPARLARS